MCGWRRGPLWPDPSSEPSSHEKSLLDVFVICELASVRLPQSLLDLRNQAETLDRIVDRRVIGESLQRIDCPLLNRFARHTLILRGTRAPTRRVPCARGRVSHTRLIRVQRLDGCHAHAPPRRDV